MTRGTQTATLDRKAQLGEAVHARAELAPIPAARLDLLAARRDFTVPMLVREAVKHFLARVEGGQA